MVSSNNEVVFIRHAITKNILLLGRGGCMPKLHLGCEVCCSGGLQINFDHLGIFNMQQNLATWAFSLFAFVRKTAAAAEIKPASFVSVAQCLGY